MLDITEILETNQMVMSENLDVRTITMGISLLDCMTPDLDQLCQNIYDKITTCAKDLVRVGDEIALEIGIPVINKRVSVTPIAIIGSSACKTSADFVKIAETLEKASQKIGVSSSALKGFPVAGLSRGAGLTFMSARRLYQAVGISFSERYTL